MLVRPMKESVTLPERERVRTEEGEDKRVRRWREGAAVRGVGAVLMAVTGEAEVVTEDRRRRIRGRSVVVGTASGIECAVGVVSLSSGRRCCLGRGVDGVSFAVTAKDMS